MKLPRPLYSVFIAFALFLLPLSFFLFSPLPPSPPTRLNQYDMLFFVKDEKAL